MTATNHHQVRQIGRRHLEITEMRRRAHQWRLLDCSDEVLEEMRHNLMQQIEQIESQLFEANQLFNRCAEAGKPLKTEETLKQIDRISAEWEQMNTRLQEVSEALLERGLRTSLIERLGNERRVATLEALVFISIIAVVCLTVVHLLLSLPEPIEQGFVIADTVICLFLIGDFLLRLRLSADKRWFWRRYWIDFISSIPFYSFLRFGRIASIARLLDLTQMTELARISNISELGRMAELGRAAELSRLSKATELFRFLRLGRAVRVLLFAFRGLDKLFRTFEVDLLKRAVWIALALLFFGALSIGAVEAAQLDSPRGLGEGLWWSFTTVVTGGFADIYNPATPSGRVVTVILVLLGLTVTGIFTASLTTVLAEDESSRLKHNQLELVARLDGIDHRIDLLSGETNQGLIALETTAQALSHQTTGDQIASLLVDTMIQKFEALETSVYLLDEKDQVLDQLAWAGDIKTRPPESIPVGDGMIGQQIAELLAQDMAEIDLEPQTELSLDVQGIEMTCPMVAHGQVVGALHVVLPDTLARYYLYNRVPMTLAHHAAMAFFLIRLISDGA